MPLASGITLTDRSGTITTGGTAQSLAAANTDRRYLLVQNPDTNGSDLWVDFGGTAAVQASPSVQIKPGGSYEAVGRYQCPTGAVSVIGATTGMPFTAKEG